VSRLHILGTANAIPDSKHENTHLALEGDSGVVLIDCVGSPVVRLEQAGIRLESITDLIATHFHPDHVSAIPLLLMTMWLMGREQPLRIFGLHHCLERLEDMMGFYHWENWPNFFPVAFHRLPEREHMLVLEKDDYQVYSYPVRHLVPTIGLRIESPRHSTVVGYSCDTEPCPAVVHLGSGANVLLHESSGAGPGHSSAEQAGEMARQAEVGRLLLLHYPTHGVELEDLVDQARRSYAGPVALAQDLMVLDLARPG
jgi:ribonuclease Z